MIRYEAVGQLQKPGGDNTVLRIFWLSICACTHAYTYTREGRGAAAGAKRPGPPLSAEVVTVGPGVGGCKIPIAPDDYMDGIDVDTTLVTLVTVRARCPRARSALQAMGMIA